MGVSTNGQLCYGILYEEGFEFPWTDSGEEDWEQWWRDENNYVPPYKPEELWGEEERVEGVTEEMIDEYFDKQREWDKANPLPFDVINVCSGDYPIYMLCVPSSFHKAWRGDPVVIESLEVDEDDVQSFLVFLDKYNLSGTQDPQWFLSSYWG
jgi:hypothetical protein